MEEGEGINRRECSSFLRRTALVRFKPVKHNVLLTMRADALPTELP